MFDLANYALKNCYSILLTKSTYFIKSPGGIRYLSTRARIYSSVKLRLKNPIAVERPEMNLSSIQLPFLNLS